MIQKSKLTNLDPHQLVSLKVDKAQVLNKYLEDQKPQFEDMLKNYKKGSSMVDILKKDFFKKEEGKRKEGEEGKEGSDDEQEKRGKSIAEMMRTKTIEESKLLTELEKKNIKKNLMYKEFENFAEDEEEFDQDSEAVKLASKF
eukprot:CAMPEP_0202959596 /NCGR_PEP_ID=MMETSP1396-20130829/3778_1 /ASSEMBLY_ACC=CAM_ASM_000872 /TAXON_ID= /ORGANISM="Pseudokeronopsis sp., Strain Brazil" /LENGTH=142 /DNA_ID=CAMNT_0049678249 /DNA_START=88 /DNA_END=516 /DNA_ORIENTATION=-